MRSLDIIHEAETDYGVEIEMPSDVLCDGDGCRHSECFCWRDFARQCDDLAREQAVAKFFADFDLLHSDSDPDPICLALREIELRITRADWDNYWAQKAAKDAELVEAF